LYTHQVQDQSPYVHQPEDQSSQPPLATSVNQSSQQALHSSEQATPHSDEQAPNQATPFINQNVALVPSQNVALTPIQHAAPTPIKQAAPTPIKQVALTSIIQNAALKQATSFFIQQTAPEKADLLISRNVVPIFSQNAILIASLFKKKVFQSNNQHLIVCLIIISTLSEREID
jgi:hypothetical protein